MEKKKYRLLLSQRQYIRLLLADAINRFGDSIDVIAYSWIMYEITGSASLMALVVGLNFVPTVFLTPFAGAFVDRISKKRVMALADLLRFVFVAAIVTLYTTGLLSPALIVVFTLATSTVEAFRLPAGGAIRRNCWRRSIIRWERPPAIPFQEYRSWPVICLREA